MSRPPTLPACMAYNPNIWTGNYGYQPTLSAGIISTILFGLSFTTHFIQCFKSHAWWQIFFILGSIMETLGWVARTVSHTCPYSRDLFIMQTALLIMGPAYLQAGVYIIYWEIISLVGKKISPVPGRFYLSTTLCLDAITLSMQAVGGGIAGSSFTSGSDSQVGTLIMVVAIIFQLVLACLFLVLFSVMLSRGWSEIVKDRRMSLLAFSAGFVIIMMIWRGFFRSIELVQGWQGYLATTERFQIACDGVPIVLASLCVNLLNPGMLLKKIKADRKLNGTNTQVAGCDSDGSETVENKPRTDDKPGKRTFRDTCRKFFFN